MKNFTKDKLKTGMIIEYRNGNRDIVLKDTPHGDIFSDLGANSYNNMKDWDEELKSVYNDNSWDIVKVYQPTQVWSYLTIDDNDIKLIWERKERVKREFEIVKVEKEYYVSVEQDVIGYLHNDGIIRKLATRDKLKTGWYNSKEEAEFAIEIYNQRFEKGLKTEDE